MNTADLITRLAETPESVTFQMAMDVIAADYNYNPSAFTIADAISSAAGSNEGSCKILAFAQLNGLDDAATLHCFGDFYRVDVLQHPNAVDHGNIRALMQHGLAAVRFEGEVLRRR